MRQTTKARALFHKKDKPTPPHRPFLTKFRKNPSGKTNAAVSPRKCRKGLLVSRAE
ncbi:hypothetical protein PUN4_590007 [Paraburkholderia unamae]|nr:hypothetical protein PUN4_590007 [Paraburkholderia unamae]